MPMASIEETMEQEGRRGMSNPSRTPQTYRVNFSGHVTYQVVRPGAFLTVAGFASSLPTEQFPALPPLPPQKMQELLLEHTKRALLGTIGSPAFAIAGANVGGPFWDKTSVQPVSEQDS
jgi:hypothetical protein